jgi:hypothetical protein
MREVVSVVEVFMTVYKATRTVGPSKVKGESLSKGIEITAVWNGRSNQPGVHELEPGSYVIAVTHGDLSSGSADIQIERGR